VESIATRCANTLPGSSSWLEFISELREASPGAVVLVMSTTLEQAHPEDAVEAGADGVLDEIETSEQIFATIREVVGG
jgi:DNA-binding NarL/FixJ family response regulator